MNFEKRIALFVDADNVGADLIQSILQTLDQRGTVVSKQVVGQTNRFSSSGWKTLTNSYGLEVHQVKRIRKGKNVTDFHIVLAACELLEQADIFAIASNDTDFLTLAEYLHGKNKIVWGFGRPQTHYADILLETYDAFFVVEANCIKDIKLDLDKGAAEPLLPLPVKTPALFKDLRIERGPKLGDGGFLHFNAEERRTIIESHPATKKLIKRVLTDKPSQRPYFLDLTNASSKLLKLPAIAARLQSVRLYRLRHKSPLVQVMAGTAHLPLDPLHKFASITDVPRCLWRQDGLLLVPFRRHASASIPAYNHPFIAGLAFWQSGVLCSRMFAVWVQFIASGKPVDISVIQQALNSFYWVDVKADTATKSIITPATRLLSLIEFAHCNGGLDALTAKQKTNLTVHQTNLTAAVDKLYGLACDCSDADRLRLLYHNARRKLLSLEQQRRSKQAQLELPMDFF